MALTLQQIYDGYNPIQFARTIEIKRRNTDGTYEDNWQDIEDISLLKLLDNCVSAVNYKLSNTSYNYGIVSVGNVKVALNSPNGQFDDESNSGSIFFGYIRHRSLIRIKDGYVDPTTGDDVLNIVFTGFIDETASGTKVDDQNLKQFFQCVDTLSFLLKDYTISDMGTLSSTTLSDLILEILNRSEFTDFFTVSSGNIAPGQDMTAFDIDQYEGQTQLYSLFENFSIGHSFYYVRDDVFYYKSITSTNSNSLLVDKKKLIKFSSYDSGISQAYERWYWSGTEAVSYESPTNVYNRSKTISIDGCTDNTDRQNVLDAVGAVAKTPKEQFTITIPYYPDVFVLDSIEVDSPEIIPDDAMVWGYTPFNGYYKWRKGISANNIYTSRNWLVKSVKHSNFTTTISLQEII